jgi:methionyl-tRNA formyltransferase
MKILLLGAEKKRFTDFFLLRGDHARWHEGPMDQIAYDNFEFIVSYGYRFLIPESILDLFPRHAVNLHISLLPWNRGADPNLWSFLKDTPKGVTIHYLDYGLDTGDVILQKEVGMFPDDSLRSSYTRLSEVIENLFMENWEAICNGKIVPHPQQAGGSYHRMKDKIMFEHLLRYGWDTPVADIHGKALCSKQGDGR